jgi:hypothetical protein
MASVGGTAHLQPEVQTLRQLFSLWHPCHRIIQALQHTNVPVEQTAAVRLSCGATTNLILKRCYELDD